MKPKRTRKNLHPDPNNPMSGYNRRITSLVLQSENLPKIDINDPQQVEDRVCEYFCFCVHYNLFPTITGLSLWIGCHRDTILNWKKGRRREASRHTEIINKAYGIIESVLTNHLMNNTIAPAVGIFFLKNHFDYKDRFDLTFEAENTVRKDPFADLSSDEAMKRLEEFYQSVNEEGDQTDKE